VLPNAGQLALAMFSSQRCLALAGSNHADEIVGGSHDRDLLTLRIAALGSLEVRHGRWVDGVALAKLPWRPMPHDGGAFAGDVPEPILVARLVLTRSPSEVAASCFGLAKAMRTIHEGGNCLCGADAQTTISEPTDALTSLRLGRRLRKRKYQQNFSGIYIIATSCGVRVSFADYRLENHRASAKGVNSRRLDLPGELGCWKGLRLVKMGLVPCGLGTM
jgi:hypothetical protein